MSWLITGTQKTILGLPQETIIGVPFGGGYFAGYISHTADSNPTHALIVAPRANGATGGTYTLSTDLAWKDANTASSGTSSTFDGAANTLAMTSTTELKNAHPAAKFCVELSIGGFTDWYLPARLEMDIAYFHLKPTTTSNSTATGANEYSVPRRNANYTTGIPAQTSINDFKTNDEQFLAVNHWVSTEGAATTGTRFNMASGSPSTTGKINVFPVRAFRRIAL